MQATEPAERSKAHLVYLGHADGGPETAQPPYHVRAVDFLALFMQYDTDAARKAVPAELDLVPNEPGFVAMYSANEGWGLTPFTAFVLAIPIRGYDSPDGSNGFYKAAGFFSGRAGTIMHGRYNRNFLPGFSRQWQNGNEWIGEAGPDQTPVLRMRLTPSSPRPLVPITSGVHHYLGESPEGGVSSYSVAYSAEFVPAQDASIEIGPNASALLQSLQPLSVPLAYYIPFMPLTFGVPQRLAGPMVEAATAMSKESNRISVLDLIARLGRAAALVSRDGKLIFMNGEAESLLAGITRDGRLRTRRPSEQLQFDRAVSLAIDQGPAHLAEPVTIARTNSDRPLVAQAIPVSRALVGEPAALVLFSDPTGDSNTDPTSALLLLGLTPAEARISALMADGNSARQTAAALSITENTVRTTLRVVYDKLAISKQSELARIVARLDGFGVSTGRMREYEGAK